MEQFHLEIVTPERTAFTEEIEAVYVPTQSGTIGVLAHHVALFTLLSDGEIKIVSGKKEYYLAIGGGYMQVSQSGVSILVSRAVHTDELNEAEIKKAYQSAKEVISRQIKGVELANAQAVLRRSLLDLKVVRRKRSRMPPMASEQAAFQS